MSSHTYRIVELVGTSPDSSDDAIARAIASAETRYGAVDWFEVVQHRGHVVDGRVAHHQVTLKIGARLPED
ncbi:dodecin [Raineyella sp. LH-20]|uniref:dodecin n=1 Tax=Raineyella sp. LH-20 TaxID=3081204 RepID=UPI00295320BD|nr:dodecin [Raineyella sp. LH-20]WOP19235.1 dodecin family protein [Raineyella sp. LH-20]